MKWEEILAFIAEEKVKNSDEFKTNIAKIMGENITDEFIKTNETISKYVKSAQDSHFDKGIETWKQNNLQKLVDAEVMKRNPAKTEEQLKLEKLEAEMNQIKLDKAKAENLAKFKDDLVKKNIPLELASLLISDDADVTKANLEIFEGSMSTYVTKKLDEKLSGRTDKKEKTENDDSKDKTPSIADFANENRLIK